MGYNTIRLVDTVFWMTIKLKISICLKIWNNNLDKMHFQSFPSQQDDATVSLSKIVLNGLKEGRGRYQIG